MARNEYQANEMKMPRPQPDRVPEINVTLTRGLICFTLLTVFALIAFSYSGFIRSLSIIGGGITLFCFYHHYKIVNLINYLRRSKGLS